MSEVEARERAGESEGRSPSGKQDGICNDCGAALVGAYCHRCGQREVDEWRSLGSIARQFWDELVNLDYKTVRSVVALLRPGCLASEFIAGRRNRYLSPLKLYFLAGALFFVIAPRVTDFTFEGQMALDWNSEFRNTAEARMAQTHISRELFAERFAGTVQKIYTLSPILSVLGLMVILRVAYRRQFPWLGPHAVFALYYVSFLYMVALIVHAVNNVLNASSPYILMAIQLPIVAAYMFVSLRRVYGEPPGLTSRKTLVVLVLAFAVDIPINILAMKLSVALT
jgi:hypothetical protein